MDQIVFILNPSAGKRDQTGDLTGQIRAYMATDGRPYEIYVTKSAGDGEKHVRLVSKYNPDKTVLFVACGGDGTLNEVVNGAAGYSNAVVTHYPCGSGNDFVRSFPERMEGFRDFARLLNGELRELDLIACCGRYSINICTVGLDARIAAMIPAMKKLPLVHGSWAYKLSILINFFRPLSQRCTITMNGVTEENDFVIAVAANGTHYGSGYNPIPEARPDDGVLEVLLVKKLSHLSLARILGKYKQGRYREVMQFCDRRSGTEIRIDSETPMAVNLDGEIIPNTSATMRLEPGAIRFLLPALSQGMPAKKEAEPVLLA